MISDWRAEVLNFWFCLNDDQWFVANPALDTLISQRFRKLWTEQRQLPADWFVDEPETALAAVILFDQLPRNMFRGDAEQFASDHLALAIAKTALEKGFDEQIAADRRAFLYLPFEHSECLADQRRSVLLFTALGNSRYLKFAKLHHDLIERFGRFPHRNDMLGRRSRGEEGAAEYQERW